jgi:hypothetical protein
MNIRPWVLFLLLIPGVSVQAEPNFDQERAFSLLGQALAQFEQIEHLPESRWLRRDQESATGRMNRFIDDAIRTLDAPDLVKSRESYRKLEASIGDEKKRVAELRERRAFAPASDTSTITKYTPTQTLRRFTASTRGDYDLLIESHQANVDAYEEQLSLIKNDMSDALAELGIDMPADQLELWLSSAIGDDVISMGVVFQSIREVTLRLAELTQESGENLDFARRYYGMVVILHKLVVRMQEAFIEKIDSEILPNLASYRDEADGIIASSRRLLRDGGRRSSLESNIAANELTKQAIDLYTRIVQSQRKKVSEALVISKREEQVAINTYQTVRLSSHVSQLIRDGLSTFETLSNLQIPDTAEFQNNEIREEFKKLTERLNAPM